MNTATTREEAHQAAEAAAEAFRLDPTDANRSAALEAAFTLEAFDEEEELECRENAVLDEADDQS